MLGKNSRTYTINVADTQITFQFNKNLGLCDILIPDKQIRSWFLGKYQGQQANDYRLKELWPSIIENKLNNEY